MDVIVIGLFASATACSGSNAPADCSGGDQGCAQTCGRNEDCTTAGQICANGVCSGSPGAGRVALLDLGTGLYLGAFEGGHYPGGTNAMPAPHANAGSIRAQAITPRNTAGTPDAAGSYVLLSMGMSNTTQEFCSGPSTLPCDSWSFMGQAAADTAVETDGLAIVNGALGSRPAAAWDSPTDVMYDDVRDTKLVPQGFSEAQVQVVWIKVANPNPTSSLPSATADAYTLVAQIGDILRAVRTRYPNVQQAYLSNRAYGGYATTTLNPEPYAYEAGFAVKWVIEAQIDRMAGGAVDPRVGDLTYPDVVPWVAWGPDLWADGTNARSDGLVWLVSDFFPTDGTHPAQSGRQKVGTMLLDFFKSDPRASCWFLAGQGC